MAQSNALAFDLGAGSGRAFVGELATDGRADAAEDAGGIRGAKLRLAEVHRFPNDPVRIGGRLHWDTPRLLHEVKRGLRKAFASGYAPMSFGIDTWGVDFGLLDAAGELAGLPYHYRDSQTDGMIEAVGALVGKEELFRQSGLQFMPFNTIYQLYAMKTRGSPKLDIAHRLLPTPDLLMYMLTGKEVCEWTMATTTQLYDPGNMAWNTALMARLGIPHSLFLEPVPPGTPVGRLLPEVCDELGGIPAVEGIAVASHDTASAVAAVLAGDGPFAYLVCGTWSLLGTELDRPLLTPETMALDFSNEGGAGGKFQLFKNIMGLWLLQECKRTWDVSGSALDYPALVAAAEEAEPFRSLIDPDDARFYAPDRMPDTIAGYCRDTGQPVPASEGEFVRAVLESLALRYREALEQAERLTGRAFEGLHLVGGGVRNALLCRLTAGAIGRPVWAGPVEASAIGNMIVQWIARGLCPDLAAARRLVADSFPVETYAPADQAEWLAAYERYRRVVTETRRSV